jgi:hypothetical protein
MIGMIPRHGVRRRIVNEQTDEVKIDKTVNRKTRSKQEKPQQVVHKVSLKI